MTFAVAPGIALIKGGFGMAAMRLAGQLFKPNDPEFIDDSKPATLAKIGSRLNLLVGRHRLGPMFVYESKERRRVITEPLAGGGGAKGIGAAAGGQRNKVYISAGVHILCVGPAWRLIKILENGKKIWPIPGGVGDSPLGITPVTHPSGSTLEVMPTDEGKSRGTFTINWGQADQPTSDFLARSDEMGFASRFGYQCYVVWNDKRLGGPGVWQNHEYDMEVRPFNPGQTHAATGTEYNDLVPQLFQTDTAGAIPQNHRPWLENGRAVDRDQCFEILQIDGDPSNSVLIAGGPTLDPTGETFLFEGTPNNILDGFLDSNAVTAGPVLSIPSGGYIRRDIALDPSTWTLFNLTAADTSGTIANPPGVVSTALNLHVPQFTMTRTVAGTTAHLTGNLVPYAGLAFPDPDTGSVGGNTAFNDGFNYVTSYVRATPNGAALSQTLDIHMQNVSVGTPLRGVQLIMHSGVVQTTTAVGGASVEAEALGNRWYKVTIGYRTGSGPTPEAPGDVFRLQYRIPTTSNADAVTIAHGRGVNGATSLLRYRELGSTTTTRITLNEIIPLSFTNEFRTLGQLCRIVQSENGPQGANAAHIMYQLLFEESPHGLGLDVLCYDIASLQAAAERLSADNDGLRSHLLQTQGTKLDAGLESLLLEAGLQRVWNFSTGMWMFKLLREEVAIKALDRDTLVGDRPRYRKKIGENMVSTFQFSYPEQVKGFRDAVIPGIDDTFSTATIEKVRCRTVRDREAAEQVARRLELQETARPRARTQRINRQSLEFAVGDVVTFPDENHAVNMRILSMLPHQSLPETKFEFATDSFSPNVTAATFRELAGGGELPELITQANIVPADLHFRTWEVSGYLSPDIQLALFRTPGDNQSRSAIIQTSGDNTNFATLGVDESPPGGQLAADFAIDYEEDNWHTNVIETGPLIKASSSTFAEDVRELTDAEWRAGQQWMLINDEVFFVREFVALGDDLFRAEGVLRARWDTYKAAHAQDDYVYVVNSGSSGGLSVPIAGRGQNLFVKAIPQKAGSEASAANTSDLTVVPTGKGIRPMMVEALREECFTSVFRINRDVVIKWNAREPDAIEKRNGFGMQGLGEATTAGKFPGDFRIEVKDTGGVVVEPEQVVTESTFTYTAAQTNVWPASVDVCVTPVYENGERGDQVTLRLDGISIVI